MIELYIPLHLSIVAVNVCMPFSIIVYFLVCFSCLSMWKMLSEYCVCIGRSNHAVLNPDHQEFDVRRLSSLPFRNCVSFSFHFVSIFKFVNNVNVLFQLPQNYLSQSRCCTMPRVHRN